MIIFLKIELTGIKLCVNKTNKLNMVIVKFCLKHNIARAD